MKRGIKRRSDLNTMHPGSCSWPAVLGALLLHPRAPRADAEDQAAGAILGPGTFRDAKADNGDNANPAAPAIERKRRRE